MIVYLVRNTINGKCYVGQSVQTLSRRWSHHKTHARLGLSKGLLGAAIRKYGEDAFETELLEEASDREDLDMAERFWIDCYNALAPHGYNLESGGNRNKRLSTETRKKIGDAIRGRTLTQQHRDKIAAAHRAMTSEEARKKGRRPGFVTSEETKQKLSAGRKGENNRPIKLTWGKVREIRSLYASGSHTQTALAKQFKCGPTIIWSIVNNKKWIEDA